MFTLSSTDKEAISHPIFYKDKKIKTFII